MLDRRTWSASIMALTAVLSSTGAMAQENGVDLMSLGKGDLKDEITRRYDEALTKTEEPAVVGEDSPAFMWASQAKAQCGIALGFLKSGTKDPVSIGKCDEAYRRMTAPPAPLPPPPTPPAPAPVEALPPCKAQPNIVFFDWDSAAITPAASSALDATLNEVRNCGATAITIGGYADRSGPDSYNLNLSRKRAESVRSYLIAHGATIPVTAEAFGEANPRVPTADGVREIQNRRVEISVE